MICKYLGLHLDCRLTRHSHIFAKRKQPGLSLTKMYWLLGHKSDSTNNKLLIYKVVLKPIWTYGIQLYSTTSNSNIEISEHFQSKVLWLIVDAPWYANESKSIHVTFTTRKETCPLVHINNVQLFQEDVKNLGLHLDRRLKWRKHILAKRKQLGIAPLICTSYLDESQTLHKQQTPRI
jgi:hypothetical protein